MYRSGLAFLSLTKLFFKRSPWASPSCRVFGGLLRNRVNKFVQELKVTLLSFAIYNPDRKLLAGGVAGHLCIMLRESTVVRLWLSKFIGYYISIVCDEFGNDFYPRGTVSKF